jgi:hypothetical protein
MMKSLDQLFIKILLAIFQYLVKKVLMELQLILNINHI